jgi:hypothetical protein
MRNPVPIGPEISYSDDGFYLMKLTRLLLAIAALSVCSCGTYLTPGGPADMAAFTDSGVKKAFSARPAIQFPANIAVVRIQGSRYRSESENGYGSGQYSILTKSVIETEDEAEMIAKLKGIEGVVRLNRLLLPNDVSSNTEVREAAAKLRADAILVYTVATEFSDREVLAPLTAVTLGLAPNTTYRVRATASAILMDTKTGFVYGALEEDEATSGIAMTWGSSSAIEGARTKVEQAAYRKLVNKFPEFWAQIYARYR